MGWGFIDDLVQPFQDAITNVVVDVLKDPANLAMAQEAIKAMEDAERAAREIQRQTEEAARAVAELAAETLLKEAEKLAKQAADEVLQTLSQRARDRTSEVHRLVPSLDGKIAKVVDDIVAIVSAAVDEGRDIAAEVKAAVEITFNNMKAEMDKVLAEFQELVETARRELFDLLEKIVPLEARPLLVMLNDEVASMVNDIMSTGNKLIRDGISTILGAIQAATEGLIDKVGKVLAPLWKFITELWKVLFGAPPEQIMITMQWFQERMKKAEWQFLQKGSAAPITAVIRKQALFDVLPRQEDAWKQQTLEFLARTGRSPVWHTCRNQIEQELSRPTSPMPGHLMSIAWEQDYEDELGGRQRLQVSVLYFRWKTEEFRAVSAGFLGILAMLSAVDVRGEAYKPPPLLKEPQRGDPAMRMDGPTAKDIRDELQPLLRFHIGTANHDQARFSGRKKYLSRQLRFKGDDGVWREVEGT
ncbi:hypothetical protein QBC47DRAFT_174298 [Echria macrotheca]|uniref:Uncharacterized protein n=1 Tax=Echria macrotheca TaxID=438768 RepID=A0AAJ0BEV9_9PEZI|nr:hypothetical protein QBC47DRAFT_174298 [Echria macrotheca]